MGMQAVATVPLFRVFDLAKAKAFYVNYLGFSLDWEHRFDERAPAYLQVSRDGLTLHLTEHHGDCCPGSTVFVRVTGLRAYHAEVTAKGYGFMRPWIESTFHNSIQMQVTDPFGNRIRFDEQVDSG
jgi:catechol 2,3-dioxygenase-like lactoylglutathione lyase family enzyme